MARARLDQLLVERGLASGRNEARGLILAGQVLVGEQRVDKPGAPVPPDAPIRIKGARCPYVSRAGSKLAGALDRFEIDPAGRSALDCGISTGGFTDCLLSRGVARVVGVDVGYGQVAHRVRIDPRVTILERTNLRHLAAARLPFVPDLVTLDVSFISLLLVLPAVAALMEPAGDVVCLIKPQFEVGKGCVGKGGIVTDPALHREVLEKVVAGARVLGFGVAGLTVSHPRGADGNREFFAHLTRPAREGTVDVDSVVRSRQPRPDGSTLSA